MGAGMAAKRWANKGSHPNMGPFVRWDEAHDAVDLELTEPTVPWLYFYKFCEPSNRGLLRRMPPHLTLVGRVLGVKVSQRLGTSTRVTIRFLQAGLSVAEL
jgi:hypothetical protein